MKRWLGGRVNGGAHVAACHRITSAIIDFPTLQSSNVNFVKLGKSTLGMRGGRPKLAGAKRRERPCALTDDLLHAPKAFGKRHGDTELRSNNAIAWQRSDP